MHKIMWCWFWLFIIGNVISINQREHLCTPPKGQTALIIGQDYHTIVNYTKAFNNKSPWAVMSYTALQSDTGSLQGLNEPIDYGSGVEWASGLLNHFPNTGLQLGLYLVNELDSVINGDLDYEIRKLIDYLAGELSTHQIYLRIGYEFDWPSNNYDPEKFILAFKYIVDYFRISDLSTKHVNFVWHSSGFRLIRDKVEIPFHEFYPGSEYIDFCGTSLFQQPFWCSEEGDPYNCRMDYVDELAEFCKSEEIPIMICESTPIGGIIDEDDSDHGPNESGFSGSTWSAWFLPVLSFIERHDVRLWSYIPCHWDSQAMYQFGGWGDSRIQSYPGVMKRWKEEVLKTDRYSWYNGENPLDLCVDAVHNPIPHHNFWSITFIFVIFIVVIGIFLAPCLNDCCAFGHRRSGYTSIDGSEMLVTDL